MQVVVRSWQWSRGAEAGSQVQSRQVTHGFMYTRAEREAGLPLGLTLVPVEQQPTPPFHLPHATRGLTCWP